MFRRAMPFGLMIGAIALFSIAYAAEDQKPAGQEGGAGQREGRGGRGGRGGGGSGRFDPAEMKQRMKERMGASDDEWKTLEPKIDKVMKLQRESRGGYGGMMGRRFGGGEGAGGDASESKVQQAQRDLYTALENKDTPDDQLTQKLTTYREARDKARTELASAQKDLKGDLKPRQEAVLVMNGMLD